MKPYKIVVAIIIALQWSAPQAIQLPPAAMVIDLAPLPAPLSTATVKPSLSNCDTVAGVAATRNSPSELSLGMPICIASPFH